MMYFSTLRPVLFGWRTILIILLLKLSKRNSINGWKYFFASLDNFQLEKNATLILRGNNWIEKASLIHVIKNGTISIGKRSFINRNCLIISRQTILIGDDALIGDNVSIYDHDHKITNNCSPYGKQGFSIAPVIIGDNVWIGSHSTILKNVTIGCGAVIAAGSVVNRNIPPFELWGGVPAKFIKSLKTK